MDDPVPATRLQLDALEQRIRHLADDLKKLHAERDSARAESEKLRAALEERAKTVRELERRLLDLQAERAEVRHRIETLVTKIDSGPEEEP